MVIAIYGINVFLIFQLIISLELAIATISCAIIFNHGYLLVQIVMKLHILLHVYLTS